MNGQQQRIVNFIWPIADDVLRDFYARGKYRDVFSADALPFQYELNDRAVIKDVSKWL